MPLSRNNSYMNRKSCCASCLKLNLNTLFYILHMPAVILLLGLLLTATVCM